MYLEYLKVKNYRKFDSEGSKISFVKKGADLNLEQGIQNKVASATTLIVGKNNSGKTTVTSALQLLMDSSPHITGNDFNYAYLQNYLKQFDCKARLLNPDIYLEFEIKLHVRITSENLIINFSPFVDIGDFLEGAGSISPIIQIRFVLKEKSEFETKLRHLVAKNAQHPDLTFRKFLELISNSDFIPIFLDSNNQQQSKVRLNQIIDLRVISANRNLHSSKLSKVFNKIIKNRFKNTIPEAEQENLLTDIDRINDDMSTKVENVHNNQVNGILSQIENKNRFSMALRSNLDFEQLMDGLIQYEYHEGASIIPENQFGLGYTNLVSIIAEIIDYVDSYPQSEEQSKINLICIEEPETYMHPQMQELFIKYIDDAVKFLLGENAAKKINSQLLITTHSAHILNSKIMSSHSFDNINYFVSTSSNKVEVVVLDDNAVTDSSDSNRLKNLKFLKKHIKYKVSELFFADAVIFVEGVTEETVLKYYLEKNSSLNKHYISIFNIDGAHGLVYHPLIKLLKIPCLIITDLDIKRSDTEKNNYIQIEDLNSKTTTNKTIKKFQSGSDDLSNLDYFNQDNIYCVFQKDSIDGQYATSFEEAYILSNYANNLLQRVLKALKPEVYKGIVGEQGQEDTLKLIGNSYKLQRKLSKSKSDFANTLLFELVNENDEGSLPILPDYIQGGLDWLQSKLSSEGHEEE